MNSKKLAQVIRNIVKEEVRKEVKKSLTSFINENKTARAHTKVQEQQFTSNASLNEALNSTISEQEEWKTVGNFDASQARAGFAAMQSGFGPAQKAPVMANLNGVPVDPNTVDESVTKAITRNYSELVKRFK